LERRPHSANEDFMSRRIREEATEKLGTSNEHNGKSSEEHETTI